MRRLIENELRNCMGSDMGNLIELYKQRLDLAGAAFSRIEHEDASVATVYKVVRASGEQLILKICPRPKDYLRERYFLSYFAKTLPVPRVVDIVQPQEGIDGVVLMECVPGTLLSTVDITDALAYEAGSLLARMHLNPVTGYGDLTAPQNLNSDPRVY
jgi:hypothetical protein